jgi:hypothetical protein
MGGTGLQDKARTKGRVILEKENKRRDGRTKRYFTYTMEVKEKRLREVGASEGLALPLFVSSFISTHRARLVDPQLILEIILERL